MGRDIKLKINGKERVIKERLERNLLQYLREELGLMGTKDGCSQGHCGACTVIVDGRARLACRLQLEKLAGSQVETIESLGPEDEPHPLQVAFREAGAIQCGFCTPGMIMAAKALLDREPDPDEGQIKKALQANLCRCTGYIKIVEAVQLAARYLKGEMPQVPGESIARIGAEIRKNDALEKARGEPVYVDDLTRENMLHGKLHLSSEPHARILQVDIEQALQVRGVVRILLAGDIPGRNAFGLKTPHQPVLADDRVRYTGDPIALVLAENREAAAEGAARIQVEYEKLPAYYTPSAALKEGAEPIHSGGNILTELKINKGNAERALQEADIVLEGEYFTPAGEHAYLEPDGGLAEYGERGITVWCPNQGAHQFQEMIAASLDLPVEQVRVITTRTGGAFGGREEPTVQIHCALGAMITGRPVKMVLSREETIRMSTKRHAARMFYRTGVNRDGRLIGAQVKIYSDTGAYASLGEPVALRHTAFALGPYVVPHVQVETCSVYTNNTPGGAFRGFGSPQVNFAAEVHMDRLAREINMDPLEFRLKNALEDGKATITGHVLQGGTGFKECLQKVQAALQEIQMPEPEIGGRIGIGVAGGYKNVGLGTGLPEKTGAGLEITPEGTIILYVGCVDSGQGSDTAMAQIASEVLNCFYEDIQVISADSHRTANVGVTTASRMVFLSGNAVAGCARGFREKLLQEAAGLGGRGPEDLELEGRQIISKSSGEQIMTLAQLGREIGGLRYDYDYEPPQTHPLSPDPIPAYPRDPEINHLHFAYCFGAHAAIVEINEEKGKIKVHRILAAHDVGKQVNPDGVESQIQGGVAMGLGYALSENYFLKDGFPVQDNLARLRLMRARDMPWIDSLVVEEIHPRGPFGAKGMAELPGGPVAPAIANAAYHITGRLITALPIQAEDLKRASAEGENNQKVKEE